ncbi:MAG: radical SAM protein [Hyphomicrobiales bacterium]|nr:MAG: radical SAM protein [Hyphomicrobiales bacterium]
MSDEASRTGRGGGLAAREPARPAKFTDPFRTADGQVRARVALTRLETLWFNTGTLCNIECDNCYIFSSPVNDRLAYITAPEASAYLDEIRDLGLDVREIGFTGGEPFMNPDILRMIGDALERGHEVLVLTNAMKPMMRPAMQSGLLKLKAAHGPRLTLRVSLDHYSAAFHEMERGAGSWQLVLDGLDWLSRHGFSINVAGRTCWNETEAEARKGFKALFAEKGWRIDADHPGELVLFPEMDEAADVPEITMACFGLLGKRPEDLMCATSRMVVKRKGAAAPAVTACTLLPYDEQFEMATSLKDSLKATGGAVDQGDILLNHCHCAKFCMLGGGSCSV